MQNNRQVGARYEAKAADWLVARGYRIRERNFRCRLGEIDLIVEKDGVLVFVEVKYRRDAICGAPQEAVGYRKQQRISNAASVYLYTRKYPTDTPCRFDVVSVSGEEIAVIENAFPYCGSFG